MDQVMMLTIEVCCVGPSWQGMDNRVWGSHVYYTTVRVYVFHLVLFTFRSQ